MHLASCTQVPLIALFGSTNPDATGPLRKQKTRVLQHHVECSPCYLRTCPIDFRCMIRLRPDTVHQSVQEMLRETVAQAANGKS